MIMEKHYYLINGKIMKGGETPETHDLMRLNDEFRKVEDKMYNDWLSSLQPCEISESELDKIYEYLNIYSSDSNPIDVTNIIDENSKSGLINFYVEPKQVDEASEAVELQKDLKDFTTGFFFWWYNQGGSNTYQGYDDFVQTIKGRELLNKLTTLRNI